MFIEEIKILLKTFNLEPRNINLYEEALTHSSYANEKQLNYNYQRLEFLGDAVLQMYTTLYLYRINDDLNEGELTIWRSQIVREETLAQVCRFYKMNEYIRLGKGEIQTGGREKDSILGDVFEAIVGAIYLDLGQQAVNTFLMQTLFNKIKDKSIYLVKDYKTLLQEYLQTERQDPIEYKVIFEHKDKNSYQYVAIVKSGDIIFGKGSGSSHSKAEQAAAKDAYLKLVKVVK
ncbi:MULTISPECIES: ribonuclease III [unclassified Spiroplasma]|uniref:ribonuclease III n=1 Tax=unclassified Spiroplasma TaxID=2637901 RepID=UPI00313E2466